MYDCMYAYMYHITFKIRTIYAIPFYRDYICQINVICFEDY